MAMISLTNEPFAKSLRVLHDCTVPQVSWEEGKVITFDDSYRHSVEHNGDRDRVVLAMQVKNPDYVRWRNAGIQQQHRRIDL